MRGAVLCAVLAAMVPASAGAQSIPLTERDTVARLSPESPRVRALRAGVEVARAEASAAARWPNPRLTIDRESVAGATEYLTMVSQPLPTSGRRGFDMQAAAAQVSASSARADDGVRRLRSDLRLAFADLQWAQVRERELTAVRERLNELAAVLGRREAAGDAAGYDRLRAEREVLNVGADLATASIDRARAQASLTAFLDGVDPARVVAAGETAPRGVVPTLEALLERAETSRGELIALKHDADAARLAARGAERRRLPEPEVVAGTKSSTVGSGDIGSVFMVHATLPLFDRATPERSLAVAREAQATARAEAFRVVLRGEVAALRTAVVQRRDAADRYRADVLQSTGEIERIAQVSYDAGERGILDLLDAYRVTAEARLRQAALDLAARRAEIELEFTTGWELPL
jgi:outer membrane protein, heavy metal efflux system